MKIFLATWIYEEGQQISLKAKQCRNRLMSYYHLSDKKAKRTLAQYIEEEAVKTLILKK